ncbi:MAG: SDR family oxidoreductase [Bacteroidia bacterium]|nr:SDR family oxidoreductase [Bacteroidia bacterium]
MVKTAVITGAADGLGYELALLLAADACHLILADKNKERLAYAQRTLEHRYGISVESYVIDLAVEGAAEKLFEYIKDRKVDVLINNAGFGVKGPFAKTNWKQELALMHLQIITLTRLTKLLLPKMLQAGEGKILNVASTAAFQPGPYMAVYYASKSFILSFTQAVAHEVKGSGVTLTALCPGPTKTNFQNTLGSDDSWLNRNNWLARADKVALYGYKAMLKGKEVAIPGAISRVVIFIERFLPVSFVIAMFRYFQKKNEPDRFEQEVTSGHNDEHHHIR